MSVDNLLGEFLRSRRNALAPEDVGLFGIGRRQVTGLRREELAMLAGLSPDYYTRLEQGRNRNPSPQVLSALASALKLDTDGVAYLNQLAAPGSHRPRETRERVRPGIACIVEQMTGLPALVLGRRYDILAANPLAGALHPGFAVGANVLRNIFVDVLMASFYLDWDDVAVDSVAGLRSIVGADLGDPRLTELVDELSAHSDRFRELWATQSVHHKTGGLKRFANPVVGEISLDYESMTVNGSDGQTMIVYSAEPGTPDADALHRLAQSGLSAEPS